MLGMNSLTSLLPKQQMDPNDPMMLASVLQLAVSDPDRAAKILAARGTPLPKLEDKVPPVGETMIPYGDARNTAAKQFGPTVGRMGADAVDTARGASDAAGKAVIGGAKAAGDALTSYPEGMGQSHNDQGPGTSAMSQMGGTLGRMMAPVGNAAASFIQGMNPMASSAGTTPVMGGDPMPKLGSLPQVGASPNPSSMGIYDATQAGPLPNALPPEVAKALAMSTGMPAAPGGSTSIGANMSPQASFHPLPEGQTPPVLAAKLAAAEPTPTGPAPVAPLVAPEAPKLPQPTTGKDKGQMLATALAALRAPPNPTPMAPPPPAALPAKTNTIDPKLLQQLISLMQGNGAPTLPSLGAAISPRR